MDHQPAALSLPFQALLDGMEGIAYVVDRDGMLLACGRNNWSSFARDNGGDAIVDTRSVIGRSILDFIAGEDVVAAYRGYMDRLIDRSIDAVVFSFRCDAPDVRRELWMTIHPIESDGRVAALLFQSIPLDEMPRPPISLFDHEALRTMIDDRRSRPIVKLCAYCAEVAKSDGRSAEVWLSAEAYYRDGGEADVRLSHGICPSCHERHVLPYLGSDDDA